MEKGKLLLLYLEGLYFRDLVLITLLFTYLNLKPISDQKGII